MTVHTYAQFDELFITSASIKPIIQIDIARIRDETNRPSAKTHVRNVATAPDASDYTEYETHAFNLSLIHI